MVGRLWQTWLTWPRFSSVRTTWGRMQSAISSKAEACAVHVRHLPGVYEISFWAEWGEWQISALVKFLFLSGVPFLILVFFFCFIDSISTATTTRQTCAILSPARSKLPKTLAMTTVWVLMKPGEVKFFLPLLNWPSVFVRLLEARMRRTRARNVRLPHNILCKFVFWGSKRKELVLCPCCN